MHFHFDLVYFCMNFTILLVPPAKSDESIRYIHLTRFAYNLCTMHFYIFLLITIFFFIPFANCTTTNKRQTAKQITKYEVKRQHLFRYLHSDDMHRLSDHFICYCFVFCAFNFFFEPILNCIQLHKLKRLFSLLLDIKFMKKNGCFYYYVFITCDAFDGFMLSQLFFACDGKMNSAWFLVLSPEEERRTQLTQWNHNGD